MQNTQEKSSHDSKKDGSQVLQEESSQDSSQDQPAPETMMPQPDSELITPQPDPESLQRMVNRANSISKVIKGFIGTIRVVSHYDADGVASAAIMAKALARDHKQFHLSFIKQLYEDTVREIGSEAYNLVIFLDMGSGQLKPIHEHLIEKGKRVIIADHHNIQGEITSDNVFQLNPNEFGIEDNISGSGATYLLARAMDPKNKDLSEMAIIGAIGDSQTGSIGAHWGLLGLNKEMLKDAQSAGKIQVKKGLRIWGRTRRPIHKALEYCEDPMIPGISGSQSGTIHFLQEIGIDPKEKDGKWKTLSSLTDEEQKILTDGIIKERIRGSLKNPDWIFGDVYDLLQKEDMKDANEFATILNSVGVQGMGYVGIGLCLNDKDYFPIVEKMLSRYRRQISKGLKWVRENPDSITRLEDVMFIDSKANISENIASKVVSILSRSDEIYNENDNTLALFILAEDGAGNVKISGRRRDLGENAVNVQQIVTYAAATSGGEGGGHPGAAGACIPQGNVHMFINSVIEIMKKLQGKPRFPEEVIAETLKNDMENIDTNGKQEKEFREGKTEDEGKGLVRYLGA